MHGGYGYMQGLPRRAADARRQDHADLGRHQPDPPPTHRPELRARNDRKHQDGRRLRRRRHHGRGHRHRRGACRLRTICLRQSAERARPRAPSRPTAFFAKSVERGKMSAAEQGRASWRDCRRTTELDDLADADLVIEAVFEDLDGQAASCSASSTRSARRTRSSPPTPRRCRSPRSPPVRGREIASSACTSACRRS